MRVAVGGLMHESNTFAASRTGLDAFRDGSLTFGDDLVPVWREAHHEVGGFLEGLGRSGVEVVPTAMAWATPGGPVEDEALDAVVGRIAEGCRSGSVDGLLVALHGAMVTPSHAGADAEVLRRLREAIGPDRPIVATLDFHANVSAAMAEAADALIGYQTYPHVDQRACGLRAAELIVRAIRGEVRPVTAVAKPPMIINLLGQETDREPMRSLLEAARQVERRPGVLAACPMAGFPYADVPEMGPSVIAVADGDRESARRVADELGSQMWAYRHDFDVRCPGPEEAVGLAIDSEAAPVVLVDLGDNIGGGTPGDGTVLLAELIRRGARRALVVLHDPEAVREPPRPPGRAAGSSGPSAAGAGRSTAGRSRSPASSGRSIRGPGSSPSPDTAASAGTTRGRRPSSSCRGRSPWF